MVRPRLAAWLASTCLVVACANGGAGDDGTADFDSGVGPVEASAGHDSSSSGSASHPDSGGSSSGGSSEASAGSDASSSGDDAGSTADGTTGNDSGSTGPETGTTQDSGSGQDTGTTSGGMCGSGSKYGIEAAAEIASGHITLCLTGTCSPGFCCYPVISPGDVCVQD
jgi:hypothetical protein